MPGILGAICTDPSAGSGTPGTPITAKRTLSFATLAFRAAAAQRRPICVIILAPPAESVGSTLSATTRQLRSTIAARNFVPPRSTL